VLNQLAQLNVAIALCIGGMVRLSMDFSEPADERPNPLVVIGFFVIMAVAIWLIMRFRRELRGLRRHWHRVFATIITFALQFALLELLLLLVVE
jgi:hypothetical protein